MFVFACLILATMGRCFGQSKSEEQTQKQPSIKVQTTLVMMAAIVTGRRGEYVKDLGEKDFDVLRDGKIQSIGFFRHVVTNADLMKPGTAHPDGVTNTLESDNQRLTIFVVDLLNSSLEEQRITRQQLLKFLSKLPYVKEPLSLLPLDQTGVRVIHDFTTDPAVLVEALKNGLSSPL
jgi:VWFA-related protein